MKDTVKYTPSIVIDKGIVHFKTGNRSDAPNPACRLQRVVTLININIKITAMPHNSELYRHHSPEKLEELGRKLYREKKYAEALEAFNAVGDTSNNSLHI